MSEAVAPADEPFVFLFGLSGSGKSYVGELVAARLGYVFHDGDCELLPEMRDAIARKEQFTEAMRDRFFAHLAARMAELRRTHPRLVVAQGAYKERHRRFLRENVPGIVPVWVEASPEIVRDRLQRLRGADAAEYAALVARNFEAPSPDVPRIDSALSDDEIVNRFKEILVGRPMNSFT